MKTIQRKRAELKTQEKHEPHDLYVRGNKYYKRDGGTDGDEVGQKREDMSLFRLRNQ